MSSTTNEDELKAQFEQARKINMSSDPTREEMQAASKSWEEKLKGKKFADDGAVSTQEAGSSFTKRDLPEKHRVVKPGQMVTMDFYPERVNVHVDNDNVCTHVSMG